ncbi:hypothetical protein SAMN04244553_0637 [Nocardia amikacinitolerans]|uniref:Uncharacterized protein n=1 Tax=Nocardia amikacinitolerans TaxID=756689 RepID=A0A285KTV8_9NOCA|nr:hypothetical protein [Nocardia amikacinitolerans]MCP2275807.1 hypothetical protein [Nocardia amikacinitolerans]MCP2294079.1 hypothetical protein [Nocardia amikacinitolerans]MCP2315032.1 hypothetical protein [Nocardia amikacinitolerans]SNY76070.1 hypothetical protein SAMN04244553_0637 [Nocardia amikacinitolerans]
MARTQQWQERERWPEAWPDEREPEDPYPYEPRPIVNPYAIVALVAALLALFPVAIVFGFIAFSHPRGRVMACFALLLGAAEVAAVAGFFVLSGNMLPDTVSRANQATATTTAQVTTVATTSAPTPAAPPPTTAPPTSTVPVVRKGEACTAVQAGLIGAASDGGTLLCLADSAADDGYQWSGPYNVGTGVYEAGAKCDSSVAKTGRTSDNRALVCETQSRTPAWVLWTE